jgi:hypothetical protein
MVACQCQMDYQNIPSWPIMLETETNASQVRYSWDTGQLTRKPECPRKTGMVGNLIWVDCSSHMDYQLILKISRLIVPT